MAEKLNILFDFDIIYQGFLQKKGQGGVFWTEYRILDEFYKNYKDKFNFYVCCSCTKDTYYNKILKEFPVFKPFEFVDIYSMNKININKLNFYIKYLRYQNKLEKNSIKKIFTNLYVLSLKFIKIFFPKKVKCDCDLSKFNIFQSFLGTTGIPDIINKQNIKKYAFLYDVLPVSNPEYFFKPNTYTKSIKSFSKKIETLSKDTTIFIDSIHAKDEFLKYFPQYKENKTEVIYLGVDTNKYFKIDEKSIDKEILSKYKIPQNTPYILSLSSLNKRKNLPFLIESFVDFLEKHPEIKDLNLVLAGPKGWLFDDIFSTIKNANKYKDRIILTGFVDDKDISMIYNLAYAFICPSVAEGFGLPVLEAMACGIPVLSSNLTSLPEVYGDSALSFNPYKKEELIECIEKIYNSKDLREDLVAKGLNRVKDFTWENTVKNMVNEYFK